MNAMSQRLCIWSGVAFAAVFGIGLVVAGFLPPPSPDDSPAQVKELYMDDQYRIRAGAVMVLIGVVLVLPWVTVISLQLRRMEGKWSPFSLTQLTSGALGVLPPTLPALMWLVAAYRPDDRSAETLSLLHDIGWLTFVGAPSVLLMQNLSIGLAILRHSGDSPVFPRWAGYLNLWIVLLLAPGFGVFFFYDGPLSWSGVFAFWIPAAAFFAWFPVMVVLLLRAVAVQEREHAAAGGDLAPV